MSHTLQSPAPRSLRSRRSRRFPAILSASVAFILCQAPLQVEAASGARDGGGADVGKLDARPARRARPGAAPRVSPRPGEPHPASGGSDLRLDILERIRCDGETASTCFVDDSWERASSGEADRSAEIDALLRDVLSGLEGHEGQLLREAEAERVAEEESASDWFGADDHLMHPSTDIYLDPVAAMSGRPNLFLELVHPDDFDYPIVLNSRVQDWMVYFLTRGRRFYARWLARAERYKPLIVPMLREAGLPEDLFYQAMIESGLNPYANSKASAVGVWQFIASTGGAYGLRRDWWVDERRDPVLATTAAISFMSDLYRQFGSWELASAAYNAGGGKISRAIRMYGTSDYWELSASGRDYLRAETKNYVPKIMAAAILGKYAERYGLTAEILDEERLGAWDFDVATVPETTDLRVVADLVGTDVEELLAINPALRREYTPPEVVNYRLNLPRASLARFEEEFAKIPEEQRVTFVHHKVVRGDTLGRIERKYGVPAAAIQRMNGISDPRRLRVGDRLLIPVRSEQLGSRTITHLVAEGETLSGIAEKYGMTLEALREANDIEDDTLRIGQKLKVVTRGGEVTATGAGDGGRTTQAGRSESASGTSQEAAPRRTSSASPDGPGQTWHQVRSGDTLSEIAATHHTTVAELTRLNGFSARHTLHLDDRIRLRPDPPKDPTTTYTVRSGDTLSEVAGKYGMSTKELMRINSLTGDQVRIGQVLKVVVSGRDGSPTVHEVVSGDTLSGIAQKYGVSVDAVQGWNGLKGTSIRVGQELTVYPGEHHVARAPSERTIDYQVQSGDTLGGISLKYGVSVDDLMAWNGLKDDVIRPGQKLRLVLR